MATAWFPTIEILAVWTLFAGLVGKSSGLWPGLSGCDVVVTSLPDDEALKAVSLSGLVPNMQRSAVHVSMSTVSPGLSRLLAAEHAAHGQGYVAAPVLGNPDFARDRRPFIIAAGQPTAIKSAQPMLARLNSGSSSLARIRAPRT